MTLKVLTITFSYFQCLANTSGKAIQGKDALKSLYNIYFLNVGVFFLLETLLQYSCLFKMWEEKTLTSVTSDFFNIIFKMPFSSLEQRQRKLTG